MYFSTTLLDDIYEIRKEQTWKSYLFGIFIMIINLPLDLYCLVRLQIYLYLMKQPIHRNKLDTLKEDIKYSNTNLEEFKQGKIRILDWNIQYGNSLLKLNTLPESIEFMNSQRLDVCLLQEVMQTEMIKQVDIIKSSLGMKYHLFHHNFYLDNIKIGNLILSQYPLTLVINKTNYQIVKITVGDNRQDIYLINVHLSSDLVCSKQNSILENLLDEIINIKKANVNHNQEIRIIMAGDLNLLSWGQNIQKVKSTISIVSQNEYTFPSNYPLVKYDYVFQNGLEDRVNIKIPQITYSDHLPILLEVDLE